MLSQKKKKGQAALATMQSLLNGILSDLTGSDEPVESQQVAEAAPQEAASAPFTSPDLPVGKVQGVRALKSNTWLQRVETPVEILVAVLATEPVQYLSAWFLKTQSNSNWLSKKVEERPLVNLASLRFSPVVQAVTGAISMLTTHGILGAPEPVILLNRCLVDVMSH